MNLTLSDLLAKSVNMMETYELPVTTKPRTRIPALVQIPHAEVIELRAVTLKGLKRVLLELDLTISGLARKLGCHRYSIFMALSRGDRPTVLKKVQAFYDEHRPVVT